MTLAEIDGFVARLMDEPAGADYSQRLGRKTWYTKHRMADRYGCPSCKPTFVKLEKAEHDVVNVNLGKPVFDAENFREAVRLYVEAEKKLDRKRPRVPAHDHSHAGVLEHTDTGTSTRMVMRHGS